ncbi:MAG: hypothetical protein RLZZ401_2047 [Pseudomonadota bacterium]
MFERLKKLFSSDIDASVAESSQKTKAVPPGLWASEQGLKLHSRFAMWDGKGTAPRFWLDGQTQGKSWRLECGAPSRDFIEGEELRFRGDLGVLDPVAVVLMNRPLKDALEKRAFQLYTDSLQTALDSNLPEEMRWLAIYQEAGWASLSDAFWDRYAVLAAKREHAQTWITQALAGALMAWPSSGPSMDQPFTLLLLHGKCYLRMEYTDNDLPTLDHATRIFRLACEAALNGVAQNTRGEPRDGA